MAPPPMVVSSSTLAAPRMDLMALTTALSRRDEGGPLGSQNQAHRL
jgi:hypothetical protein